MAHADQTAQGGHGRHQHGGHGDGLREMLDLDAEVGAAELARFTARIAALAGDHPVRDVVDLGAGTGSGTFALLRQFSEAIVTAVDTSGEMLGHLSGSARQHGFDSRVRPIRADLDERWPATGPADLVWAASSMHHLADPDRVLRDIHATLRPAGRLAMIEMESMPHFLPDDIGIGAPGLEDRCDVLMAEARAEHLPHMGSDWTARLTMTGFKIQESGDLVVDLPAPVPDAAARYAYATLQRLRAGLADRLTAEDRDTLDVLLADDGPHALRNRADLTVRSTRSFWIATPA
ncbi:class I SAM-dependent methyltransferase [Actinoplanes sp. NPDC023801]|uniref:class I SAM-dependent methyltransferase n=1 Tax=Actinoplanes sp. NPDC023801 TaxID=3154595 RepID=UPI0033E415B4